jgi:hypothetical protein
MRVAVVACLCFGCSYNPPVGPGGNEPDAAIVKLDAPPVTECTPNETFCNGRTLATCNADGTGIASSVTCPLTCENAQCLAASNVSDADQLTCQNTASPPTFMPTGNVDLDNNNGTPRLACEGSCGPALGTSINGTIVKQSGNRDVALFCLGQVRLEAGRTLSVTTDFDVPAVFLVLSDVVIDGEVHLDGGDGNGQFVAGDGKAGGGNGGNFVITGGDDGGGPCLGHGGGRAGLDPGAGGGGGGGNVAVGGGGGDGRSTTGNNIGDGGAGGDSCADSTFLVGGSGGGGGADGGCGIGCGGWPGGGGGGALQISTAGNFQLGGAGRLRADGGNGDGFNGLFGESGGGGGGAGGTFLIEGKGAVFTTNSLVQVRGGDGGRSAAGNGGAGARGGVVTGGVGTNQNGSGQGGSGGGGAGGRIKINVPVANPAACTGVQTDPTGVCTTGVLRAL